jgi:hypothetical protein
MIYRATSVISISFVLGLACASHETIENESSTHMRVEAGSERRSPEPTARMIALAHVLSGSIIPNEWFSAEDVERTEQLVFPSGSVAPHPSVVDRIKDPSRCAVERSSLTYAGEVQRTEVVELKCDEFWRMIRDVDDYYEKWGFLPSSSTELEMFLGTLELE